MSTFTRRALVTAATATAAAGAATIAPAAKAQAVETTGEYLSTMSPSNTGAANAAAFEADVVAAAGKQIVVPPGTYTVAAVDITGQTINVRFMPGTLLQPDASLHAVGPAGKWFQATDCDTRLYGLVANGSFIPEGCWRSDGGQFRAYDTTITNMGFTDLVGNATSLGTYGILCKGTDEVIIDGYVGDDFQGRKDGVFANNAGKVNHLFMYECERVAIRNVTISRGEGEDNDFFHILDLRAVPTMHGTIESCHLYYNEQTRRCMKFQGGNWDVRDIHCYPGSDFEPAGTDTDVGSHTLNCIDWAGSIAGTLRLSDSYIDATGFVLGVSHSIGPLGKVVVENCTIVGGRRHAKRPNPEAPSTQQDIQTMGFFAATSDNESEIRDCVIKGFSRSIVVQGNRNRVVGNTIDDPQELWFQGGSSARRDFLELAGNKVYTRTPGAMPTTMTRCGRVDNYTNLEVHDNTLIQVLDANGVPLNPSVAPIFLDVLHIDAAGFATGNRAPAGITPVRPGSSKVLVFQNQGQLLRPLLTLNEVGNVTVGEDALHSHVIPAQQLELLGAGVRTTFSGTTANNANPKTLRIYIGTVRVLATSLTPGIAGAWEVQLLLVAVGPGQQRYTVKLLECDTAGSATPTASGLAVGSLTQASTASITVRITGEGVASNDVVARLGVSESLEGRHFVLS